MARLSGPPAFPRGGLGPVWSDGDRAVCHSAAPTVPGLQTRTVGKCGLKTGHTGISPTHHPTTRVTICAGTNPRSAEGSSPRRSTEMGKDALRSIHTLGPRPTSQTRRGTRPMWEGAEVDPKAAVLAPCGLPPCDPSVSLLGVYLKILKTPSGRDVCTPSSLQRCSQWLRHENYPRPSMVNG